MSWLEKLHQTYENCQEQIGRETDPVPLLPICHTTQNAHVEITLDTHGRFLSARALTKEESITIIPCTEASGGRSGKKPTTHPLCDKLQYVAADYTTYEGEVTSGFVKNPAEPHETYLKLLSDWCNSTHKHEKVAAVLKYVQRGTVMEDLIKADVIPYDSTQKKLIKVWKGKNEEKPPIFKILPPGSAPEESFVRWTVEAPGDKIDSLAKDSSVWESWMRYYVNTKSENGLCYVTGERISLSEQHPAKLRNAADKAKLISANDSSGFTFRGRFTDTNGTQACGVGFEITQKAHNALRWLIGRQAYRDGDMVVISWTLGGKRIAPIDAALAMFGETDEDEQSSALSPANVAQDFALRLNKKIAGFRVELGTTARIMIMALDSATPGRMSITHYRELTASELLARVESWHTACVWHQNYGEKNRFFGSPSPRIIAETAYGRRADEKLRAATFRRLLPCIIDAAPLPNDIVQNCVQRACNREAMDSWEWERTLGVACALYRKHIMQTEKTIHQPTLEHNRNTRDYLYGRLLAIADFLENRALWIMEGQKGESKYIRPTNAARLMQRFAQQPFATWPNIEMKLEPYRKRLLSSAPALLTQCEKELDSVMKAFNSDEFISNEKLSGEFLLGFHCQRHSLWNPSQDKSSQNNLNSNNNQNS